MSSAKGFYASGISVEHYYQGIPGWCDYADYYRRVVAWAPDGAHLVEVGAWQGQSTACMGVEIANSGKVIRFDVVDHFRGSPKDGVPFDPDLRAKFDAHTAQIRHYIRDVHAEPSIEAATRYADASLDWVWIDASHRSPDVLADLQAWWPKITPGGRMGGHDLDWESVQAALIPFARLSGVEVLQVDTRAWELRKPARMGSLVTPAGERRCLVAVCSNERTIYRATAHSLITLGWGGRVTQAAERHGFADVQFAWLSRHTRVDDLRNEAVLMARAVNATHLLFLDADMTWPPDVLARMLAHHDQGIVSGLYFLKQWPNWPVALGQPRVNLDTKGVDYTYDDAVVLEDRLHPEALVGMGCTLVPMAVCDALEHPWFSYEQNEHGVWTVTEDVAFCQRAAAVGCPIWIDSSVKCGHVASEAVTESWFLRSQVEQRALAERQARITAEARAPRLVAV